MSFVVVRTFVFHEGAFSSGSPASRISSSRISSSPGVEDWLRSSSISLPVSVRTLHGEVNGGVSSV